MYLHIT